MRPIDADALSEKLCKTTVFIKDGEVFQRMINDAPTVSAEAVRGEWILDGGTPICSVCHEEPCWSSEGYDFTDFCPNCGARMMTKGGDDE